MCKSAKTQAIQDIKESLRSEGRCFIAFHRELNPVMSQLVTNHLKAQKQCK